jgi:hypothetical protein
MKTLQNRQNGFQHEAAEFNFPKLCGGLRSLRWAGVPWLGETLKDSINS